MNYLDQARRPGVLNVALLGTRGIPASYGGFETFAEQLALRLVQRGHQVTVYAESSKSGLPDTWYQGVRIRHIHRPNLGALSVVVYDWRCLSDARSQNFSLLYMLGYVLAWACWWARKVWGKRVWINIDGLEWARSKWSWYARLYLRLMEWVSSWAPDRVIADAQAIADRYKRLYPRGVACHFLAYGAVVKKAENNSADLLDQWKLVQGEYILVVARPEPENHLKEIIDAYIKWGGKWPLVIVGDIRPVNPYQMQLLKQMKDRVISIGGIYDNEVLTALRLHAACHIHGHSVGGTNPSLLEALACGNIVIAHNNVFNREVAGDVAWFFKNDSELIECLDEIYGLSDQRKIEIKEAANRLIAKKYTWEIIVNQYEELMMNVCEVK